MASELWAKDDQKRLIEGIRIVYRYLFVGVLPLIGILFVFAPFLLRVFVGQEYVSGAFALQILLIGVFLFTLSVTNHSVFTAIGKPHLVTMIIFISAMVNVGLNLLLIPRFGITGAAISTSASYIVAFVISVWKMNRHLGIDVPWKQWIKLLFVGWFFIFLLYKITSLLNLNPWFEMISAVIVSSVVYLFLIYCFKIIDVEEMKKYFRLIRWKESS